MLAEEALKGFAEDLRVIEDKWNIRLRADVLPNGSCWLEVWHEGDLYDMKLED